MLLIAYQNTCEHITPQTHTHTLYLRNACAQLQAGGGPDTGGVTAPAGRTAQDQRCRYGSDVWPVHEDKIRGRYRSHMLLLRQEGLRPVRRQGHAQTYGKSK